MEIELMVQMQHKTGVGKEGGRVQHPRPDIQSAVFFSRSHDQKIRWRENESFYKAMEEIMDGSVWSFLPGGSDRKAKGTRRRANNVSPDPP